MNVLGFIFFYFLSVCARALDVVATTTTTIITTTTNNNNKYIINKNNDIKKQKQCVYLIHV